MRCLVVALIALLVSPSITLAGKHGHLKKLHEAHQQHKFKHQLKKAMKEGCKNCGEEEEGARGHHLLHHHKK